MTRPITHLLPNRGGSGSTPIRPGSLVPHRRTAQSLADWAWINSRLGDCEPAHRAHEASVQRRDEALDSAAKVMRLHDEVADSAAGESRDAAAS